MAEGTSLAKAYVQILPSMEGFQGKLEEGLGGSGAAAGKSSGASFGDAFSAAAGVAIKASAAAITAGVAGVSALTKSAVDAYADFEQLAGGAQLLFGDAYDSVAKKASEAYATVQMSQNEYLEQVNGLATGLSTALGGNKQAAADLADKIITAEADIIAATGNSQEAVQNAFNGIMKSNYTMLDNLQLGITPTKAGMQEVIDKVNEWNAAQGNLTKYSMENLADQQAALVDYINMVGMAGYAQNEAAGTIQGSLGMTKSAWENLVAGIANPDADIGALVDKLVTSAGYAADNLIPVIKTALEGAGQLIAELAPEIFGILPDLLNDTLPGLMSAVNKTITNVIPALADGIAANLPSVITSTMDALQTALPQLYNAGKSIVGALGSAIAENSGEMLRVAMELVTALMDDIGDSLPKVLPQIAELIVDIADTLTSPENLTPMIQAALGIIKGLADGIVEALPTLIRAVPQIISNIMTILTEEMPKLLTTGQEVLTSLITGILDNLPLLVQVAFDLVDSLVTFVLDNLPQLLELAAQLILALVQGITENLPKIAEGAGELIPKIIATVVDKLPEIIDTGFEITVELVKGILKALPKIVESVVQLIGSMCIKFTEYDWLSLGKNLILGIKDGVVQYAYELINAVTDAGEKAYNAVKDFFGIASPSKLMRDGIGAYLPAGIAAGIMENENDVTSAMNALADDVAGITFGLPDIQGGNYSGANGGYGAYAAQPAIIQFVLPNGQVIAQWLEPDISAIQDRKIMIGQRGYAT